MKILHFTLFVILALAPLLYAEEQTKASSNPPPSFPKILGGKESKQGDWPWITAILHSDEFDMYQAQFCGGVLISKNWVLTAAHCVENKSPASIGVAVGVFDLRNYLGSRIPVNTIHIHPQYNTSTLQNDIALLRLATPSSKKILPLFSGESEENISHSLLGKPLTAIGWGLANSVSTFYYPGKLRQVNLPVVADSFCKNIYMAPFTSSQLCAGYYVGKDVCNGDSGGPVISLIDGAWVHTGLVSYGTDCTVYGGWYGVYTRTSSFAGFIRSHVPDAKFTPVSNPSDLAWLPLLLD